MEIGAVVGIRDAGAAAVRVEERVGRTQAGDEHAPERGDVVEAVLVEERLVVSRGEQQALLAVGRLGDVEDPARGLLLEPLARVSLVDPGRHCELVGRQRAALRERAVQPEPVAQIHAAEIERTDHGSEEPFDEGVALFRRRDRACLLPPPVTSLSTREYATRATPTPVATCPRETRSGGQAERPGHVA